MRIFWGVLAILLAIGVTVPSEAGLDVSKQKEPKIIKPSTKTFKTFKTKKYSTKTKKSKKYKTKKVKSPNSRKPQEEKAILSSEQKMDTVIVQQDSVVLDPSGKVRPAQLIEEPNVEQVADQNATEVTKTKKLKDKKKASQSDINKFSKVTKDGSEDISMQPAGGGE